MGCPNRPVRGKTPRRPLHHNAMCTKEGLEAEESQDEAQEWTRGSPWQYHKRPQLFPERRGVGEEKRATGRSEKAAQNHQENGAVGRDE